MSTTSNTWKDSLLLQINSRNNNQIDPFKQIFQQHQNLLIREKSLSDRVLFLEKEIGLLKAENGELKREKSMIKDNGGDNSKNKVQIAELETKIQRQQEELTNSYKRTSEHTQMLLDLNQKTKVFEEEIKSKDEELAMWRARDKAHEENERKLQDQSNQSNETLQLIQGELQVMHTQYDSQEGKMKQLQSENDELVARWLARAEEQAAKMNETNEIYDRMLVLQTQVEVLQRQLQERQNTSSGTPHKPSLFDLASISVSVRLPSKPRRKVSQHTGEVTSVAYSPSGQLFASGSGDKTVRLYDGPSGVPKSILMGAVQGVMSVRFSPNEEFILASSNDNAARVWHVEQGRVRHTLTGHIGKVFSAIFAGDSARVVTGSHDRALKMWDLTKGYCTRTLFCQSSCNDVTISTDGTILVSGHIDHHVRVWDARSGDMAQDLSSIHEGQVTSVAMSPDGLSFLTNSRDHLLRVVDVRTFEVVHTFKDESYRNGLNWNRACWSPDGHFVASGSLDGSIFIWNASSAKLDRMVANKSGHTGTISCCAWSPDGSQFISAGDKDKQIIMWDP